MSLLVEQLAAALGADGVLQGTAALEARDAAQTRGLGVQLGTPLAVVKPRSTEEVARALALAHAAGQPVVPWGGCTGLVDGSAADGASISGEHGIGLQKRSDLPLSRTPEEIALMRTLKQALDPRNILNPGKVLPASG